MHIDFSNIYLGKSSNCFMQKTPRVAVLSSSPSLPSPERKRQKGV